VSRGEADLELILRWRPSEGQFDVSLAYDDPSDPYDRRDLVRDPIVIDTEALNLLADDEPAYGIALSNMLFAPDEVHTFFVAARAVADERGLPLHLRLHIDPQAPRRFQGLRWESLRDPDDRQPIATRPNVLLSRYLSSGDWRKIVPPPRHDLHALVVVANPTDLARYQPGGAVLHQVKVDEELRRAHAALAGMHVTELVSDGEATLDATLAALERGIDVLYLVCHGVLTGDEPRLYLEQKNGTTDPVDGALLADRVAELQHRPTLAVLCSCQSAGDGEAATTSDEGALSALGPRLAAAGVAAVVAMQGNITMRTAGKFLTEFFRALSDDGVVDRAAAVARGAVREEPDWWVPALFSRLRSGRTYYKPEFAERGDFTFGALVSKIKDRECTPVLGSGMADPLLPSRESIARSWADRWQMPIAQHARGDLAKVAQFLRVRAAPDTPRTELRHHVLAEFRRRWGDQLPAELFRPEQLPTLLHEIALLQRKDDEDSYQMVANLDLPVYVTTSWTGLLEDALVEAGRQPIVRSFAWHRNRDLEGPLDFDPHDRDHPLVYHLFGQVEDLESLVLSEDDYFAWLTAWIRRSDLIPDPVRAALTSQSLLFLGYRLDDWEFRVLFQSIKSFPGSSRLGDYVHVGVQLNPGENQDIEPEAVQDYLESSFSIGKVRLNIYWGESYQFLQKLRGRMRVPA
jgi:CHAT domain/SIR2-like domain